MAANQPVTGSVPGAGAAMGALAGFSEPTASWFRAAFAEPTAAQVEAWQAIGNGENVLVVAPTGSGKTLAAFLWAIDKLTREITPEDAARRCRVLYISPLKALAVDIEGNLRSPRAGVGRAMRRTGRPEPQIRVGVRTGDTAADERRQLASKPPDILITTPESLFLLLTSRAREGLRSIETVIIDEVHALAGGKRGAHLALSLERLDALRGAGQDKCPPAQRIGLSATVRPPEEVASFLGGALPVTIAAPPSEKRLDLKIVVPVEDMADLGSEPDGAAIRPSAIVGPAQIGAQAGVGNPAGSAPGTSPHGRTRAKSIWPHVEAEGLDAIGRHRATIVFANSRRLAERLCPRLNELAAERAAEQAELAGADPAEGTPQVVAPAHHGSLSRAERAEIEEALKAGRLPARVRRAAPFSGLTRSVLEAVLGMLAGRYPSEEFAGLRPRLVWDRATGMLRGRPGAQRLAVTNGGTIPDRGLFGVFLAGAT